MTSYAYTITLRDTEMITLTEALDMMAARCDQELAAAGGSCAPYWAWRQNVETIRDKLFANMRQTSGGGIDPKTGKYSIWVDLSGRPSEDSKS